MHDIYTALKMERSTFALERPLSLPALVQIATLAAPEIPGYVDMAVDKDPNDGVSSRYLRSRVDVRSC